MKKNKDVKVSVRLESELINDLMQMTNDINVSNAIRIALKSYVAQTKNKFALFNSYLTEEN